ncbi:MAG: hypothetical protein ACP5D7_08255 [Limnospira sp.]
MNDETPDLGVENIEIRLDLGWWRNTRETENKIVVPPGCDRHSGTRSPGNLSGWRTGNGGILRPLSQVYGFPRN